MGLWHVVILSCLKHRTRCVCALCCVVLYDSLIIYLCIVYKHYQNEFFIFQFHNNIHVRISTSRQRSYKTSIQHCQYFDIVQLRVYYNIYNPLKLPIYTYRDVFIIIKYLYIIYTQSRYNIYIYIYIILRVFDKTTLFFLMLMYIIQV